MRYFDAVDLHCGLVGSGGENNDGPHPAGRNLHNPGQVLVEAMHPQPVQVDTRRLSAKLAAPLDETRYLQISYSRKIFDWVGKCANNARGHASPPGARLSR
jgi:hypothetical protein